MGVLGKGRVFRARVCGCAGWGAWGCGRRGSKAWGLMPVQLPDQSQEEAGAEFGMRCLFSCR